MCSTWAYSHEFYSTRKRIGDDKGPQLNFRIQQKRQQQAQAAPAPTEPSSA